MSKDNSKNNNTLKPPFKARDLTPKERFFVKAYTNPEAPTYLNATKSALEAYDVKPTNAEKLGPEVAKRPVVALALKDALGHADIDNLLTTGIFERLKDPYSRHWQPTADFVAKIRGDFAPDKQIQVQLNPEDRDKKYEEILKIINKTKTEPSSGGGSGNT